MSVERSTGCVIFTAKLLNKTVLIHLSIDESTVEYEFIELMHSFLSLGGGDQNDPVYHYFSDLLKELRNVYDYIILDTAPMMLVTDSFLIADVADVTLYVTRSGYTDKELVSFINKQVKDKKIKN